MAKKPRIVAVIQARMGSTRLPGKALADINGRPMLGRVADRARRARVDLVVVATSRRPEDQALADFCAREKIGCFRGHETDVLDRFHRAALRYRADVIVRITADCPLLDPGLVDKVLDRYRKGGCDYASNTLTSTYPDGLDVEVFSAEALRKAHRKAKLPADREHVTSYIRSSGEFRLAGVESRGAPSLRDLRWTVDEPADLEFVRGVYAGLAKAGKETGGLPVILDLLRKSPGLAEVNRGFLRNEGYYKSLAKEPAMAPSRRKLSLSMDFKRRAEKLIPSCSQTFSKAPFQFVQGVSPVFLSRGKGSHVWDVDGNEYIDYPLALGPVILGHLYPAVNEAAVRQITGSGTSFSLPHPLEVELAETLCRLIPCAEMVRFGKNGSDATSGAVRAARAYTGREKIICCGYHGWQDWYIGSTTRRLGVPKAVQDLTMTFAYNDIGSLDKLFRENPGQIAAVIMEPLGVAEPGEGFLEQVKSLAHLHGALLIFDEIVTGFRIALGGAQSYYNVIPDMACFGKALANGFPLSAVAGRRDVMRVFNDIFFSFTFGGEAASLAAAGATLKELESKDVISHLWEQGQKLKDGYNVLAGEFGVDKATRCVGLAPRTAMTFGDVDGAGGLVLRSLLQQELIKRGVLFLAGHNICFSHSQSDVDHTLRAHRAALEVMARALDSGRPEKFLEGEPVRPVFRKP